MEIENWQDIPGFPGYQISDQGRLRSFLYSKVRGAAPPEGRILVGGHDRDGYRRAVLCADDGKIRKSLKISHLVAAAFIGPRPRRSVVRHMNGDHTDDRAANLRYGTQRQNIGDKVEHGTMARGEGHGSARLTEIDVRAIRASTEKLAPLAARYGVSQSTISAIRHRRLWAHID